MSLWEGKTQDNWQVKEGAEPWVKAPLVAQKVKNLPAVEETQVWSLGQKDPLEKGMAIHSNILAWRIPWMEEPSRLQSMGSQSQTQLSDWHFTFILPATNPHSTAQPPGCWQPGWYFLSMRLLDSSLEKLYNPKQRPADSTTWGSPNEIAWCPDSEADGETHQSAVTLV